MVEIDKTDRFVCNYCNRLANFEVIHNRKTMFCLCKDCASELNFELSKVLKKKEQNK